LRSLVELHDLLVDPQGFGHLLWNLLAPPFSPAVQPAGTSSGNKPLSAAIL